MISLDDEQALRAADPSGLLDVFATLPAQLKEGYDLGRAAPIRGEGRPRSVVLCGMGGSAAAADVAAGAVFFPVVPISVVRGEELPEFVDERDLVVCISYSGETDEILWAADEAAGKGARLVCIASGGRLAKPINGPSVVVPDSAPTPRAALGWLTGATLGVLDANDLSGSQRDWAPGRELSEPEDSMSHPLSANVRALEQVTAGLRPQASAAGNLAKQIAGWLGDRIPVIWATHPHEGAALRWKAGFNENAKIPAFASTLPELAHHEIEGWTKRRGETFAVIVLRTDHDSNGVGDSDDPEQRAVARLAASLEILDEAGVEHREVRLPSAGPSLTEFLGLMVTGDFASAYHALMRGIDPTPIEAIARLKARLR